MMGLFFVNDKGTQKRILINVAHVLTVEPLQNHQQQADGCKITFANTDRYIDAKETLEEIYNSSRL